jgi:hypothetical protein
LCWTRKAEKVLIIASFTLGLPRPAQLDGWYTAGRKSLLFYLLPWAFLVQHNWPVVLDEEHPRKKIE